jgi:hypothetical protein
MLENHNALWFAFPKHVLRVVRGVSLEDSNFFFSMQSWKAKPDSPGHINAINYTSVNLYRSVED